MILDFGFWRFYEVDEAEMWGNGESEKCEGGRSLRMELRNKYRLLMQLPYYSIIRRDISCDSLPLAA